MRENVLSLPFLKLKQRCPIFLVIRKTYGAFAIISCAIFIQKQILSYLHQHGMSFFDRVFVFANSPLPKKF